MANKKVKVLKSVVDGHGEGEEIEVDAKSAEMLVRNGYVELVVEKKAAPKKDEKKDNDDDK